MANSLSRMANQISRIIILAGGESRRLGEDKILATLGSHTALDFLLLTLAPTALPITAVGPTRPTVTPVNWVREDPPGGGPAAAIAAALSPNPAPDDWVVILAGDQPAAAQALASLTAAMDSGLDAVLAVDPDGVPQPLLGLYRQQPLHTVLDDRAAGRSMRSVLAKLTAALVPVAPLATLDLDTASDLDRARDALANFRPSDHCFDLPAPDTDSTQDPEGD